MDFIGRKKEIAVLEEHYQMPSGFVVIYGRRRVGKTTLIKEFIKNKSALYFLATTENEEINMQSFLQQLAAFTSREYLQNAKISDWIALFALFAEHKPAQKKILVIDEFQYLAEINSAFPSLFQKAWDEILSKHNIMVILCGSYISLMEKHTLSSTSPLFGRRTAQIKLPPLSFAELSAHYTNKTFAELVSLYAITGGVPKYLEFFDNDVDIFENINSYILNKNGYLYEEPILLLEKEVKKSATYLSILKSIARRHHTRLQEIAADLQMEETTLSPYLKNLIDLHIIERRVPIPDRAPEHSRKGRYRIQDGFFKFWFLFVSPNKSELEMGSSAAVLKNIRLHFIDQFVGFAYEDVCRELFRDLCNSKKIPFEPSDVGGFWDRNVEIDVSAIDNSKKKLFVGECKYNVVGMKVYKDLLEKCQRIPNFDHYEIVYGLFSATGFDARLRELAKENPKLHLIEKDPTSGANNDYCTVKDRCSKVHGDYGAEPEFTVGVHRIKNSDLFRNVINYGSSLKDAQLPPETYRRRNLAVLTELEYSAGFKPRNPEYEKYLKDRENQKDQMNQENCRNDWFTFRLIVEGVANEWSDKILQKYFGNIDVKYFIKMRAEILSYAANISNAICTVKDHCNKVHGDYGAEPEFAVGAHRIKNSDLFRNVINYGSSLQDRYALSSSMDKMDLENCRNDWFTFRLIAEGVASEWSVENLQEYFGDDDVERFRKKLTEILSYAEKISKNAEQALKEIESGSNTEAGA